VTRAISPSDDRKNAASAPFNDITPMTDNVCVSKAAGRVAFALAKARSGSDIF
jgi:hypothetical protein